MKQPSLSPNNTRKTKTKIIGLSLGIPVALGVGVGATLGILYATHVLPRQDSLRITSADPGAFANHSLMYHSGKATKPFQVVSHDGKTYPAEWKITDLSGDVSNQCSIDQNGYFTWNEITKAGSWDFNIQANAKDHSILSHAAKITIAKDGIEFVKPSSFSTGFRHLESWSDSAFECVVDSDETTDVDATYTISDWLVGPGTDNEHVEKVPDWCTIDNTGKNKGKIHWTDDTPLGIFNFKVQAKYKDYPVIQHDYELRIVNGDFEINSSFPDNFYPDTNIAIGPDEEYDGHGFKICGEHGQPVDDGYDWYLTDWKKDNKPIPDDQLTDGTPVWFHLMDFNTSTAHYNVNYACTADDPTAERPGEYTVEMGCRVNRDVEAKRVLIKMTMLEDSAKSFSKSFDLVNDNINIDMTGDKYHHATINRASIGFSYIITGTGGASLNDGDYTFKELLDGGHITMDQMVPFTSFDITHTAKDDGFYTRRKWSSTAVFRYNATGDDARFFESHGCGGYTYAQTRLIQAEYLSETNTKNLWNNVIFTFDTTKDELKVKLLKATYDFEINAPGSTVWHEPIGGATSIDYD